MVGQTRASEEVIYKNLSPVVSWELKRGETVEQLVLTIYIETGNHEFAYHTTFSIYDFQIQIRPFVEDDSPENVRFERLRNLGTFFSLIIRRAFSAWKEQMMLQSMTDIDMDWVSRTLDTEMRQIAAKPPGSPSKYRYYGAARRWRYSLDEPNIIRSGSAR